LSQLQKSNKSLIRAEDRRFIEETFPVKEVSEESAREKNIRQGHISTLHNWWARRPLASSRATNFSALINVPIHDDELQAKRDFVVQLCKWENSLDNTLLERAGREILAANGGKRPKVLDPFAGGGAIPLEAIRLGCETYASDYNPVANLILKCTLEYPQKYRGDTGRSKHDLLSDKTKNILLDDVKKWGQVILEQTSKEIGGFYPQERDGSIPVGYIWARTIQCQNPSCNAEIPLIRQFWLATSKTKKVSLFPYVIRNEVRFKVVGTGYESMPKGFDPAKGTTSDAVATCLICRSVASDKTVRSLFADGKSAQRMIAIVLDNENTGRKYRVANDGDTAIFEKAEQRLHNKRKALMAVWGFDPVPDEPLPPRGTLGFRIQPYGMTKWGDLFNSRQKLALLTFVEAVRMVHKRMIQSGYEEEYARAIASYLALGVDRLVDYGSTLCLLNSTGGRGVVHTFGRQALQMTWDYAESNPFNPSGGGWPTACEKNERWIEHASSINNSPAAVFQSSATKLPYTDGFFDAVFTDPPYYDNVPYSHLSDFFYVWLKRAIGPLYPDLFATPLTPKADEIVAYSRGPGGYEEGKQFFEQMLKKSFTEIRRILRPNGISTIVYAHKSTQGWETLINSLLDSGLVVTGAWPIHTEKKGRLRSQESAALASSIYMVARKVEKRGTGFYREVKEELREHLNTKLHSLWGEGISGADFFISAIGSSIQVFGKYEKVIDDEGTVIRADRLLEDVRRIVTDYAVRQVLHNGFVEEISPMTRFYVLWRWAYADARLEFDDAQKLAQTVGIDLGEEWNRGFIKKDKEFIDVLAPDERALGDFASSNELIDVLHHVLLLWKKGKQTEILEVLRESGFGKSDVFYGVAQAIAESLPDDAKEKKLIEGFLQGRQRISEDIRQESEQRRLFE
jgi:adenine-specific DNA methylase